MSNDKKIIAFLIILGLIIGGVFGFIRYQDYRKFTKASGQLDNIIQQIRSLGIKDIKKQEYCSYGHQKYSKGDLGCEVNVVFKDIVDSKSKTKIQKIVDAAGWTFRHDNTTSLGEYTSHSYVLSRAYSSDDLSCSFVVEKIKDMYEYSIGCHGAAKMEYFPVRE